MEKSKSGEHFKIKFSFATFSIALLLIITSSFLLFFKGIIEAGTIFSILVLSVTAWAIAKQSFSTERMVKDQTTPVVETYLNYKPNQQKSCFWFINSSKDPAFVKLQIKTKNDNYEVGPLRISSNILRELRRTAVKYDFMSEDPTNGFKLTVKTTSFSALEGKEASKSFVKEYRFDKSKLQWKEKTWNSPDPIYPLDKSKDEISAN